METKRNAYWDNLKAILIFLVVLGHFLTPVANKRQEVQLVYDWIFYFHMPAFVFVSGVFSKSFVKKDYKEYKLTGFLIIYFLFSLAVLLADYLFVQKITFTNIIYALFSQGGAPWYMLAMFFWYIIIPYVSCIRSEYSFPLLILLALAVGKFNECGNFLVLSRTIVFFPFFVAGYHFKTDIQLSEKKVFRAGGFCFLLFSVFILFFWRTHHPELLKVIYANSSYSHLELSFKQGVLFRTLWYFFASCMTVSLMCIVPRKRLFFTYIGERTLSIYIIHRLIRGIFKNLGGYSYLGSSSFLLPCCVFISCFIVTIASLKPLSDYLNKVFQLNSLMIFRE